MGERGRSMVKGEVTKQHGTSHYEMGGHIPGPKNPASYAYVDTGSPYVDGEG